MPTACHSCCHRCLLVSAVVLFAPCPTLAFGSDEMMVPFSMISPGSRCGRTHKDVSLAVTSVQECANLVCSDPQCGPLFEASLSREVHRCSCQGIDQTCDQIDDAASIRYQILDPQLCKSRADADCFASLHENGDFSGWSANFPEGAFSDETFETAGAVPGAASAIFVSGDGCLATVYQHSGFSGWSVSFPEGSYTGEEFIKHGAIDDDVRAITVRHRNSVDPAKAAMAASQGLGHVPRVTQQTKVQVPVKPSISPQAVGQFPISPPPSRWSFPPFKELSDWPCDLETRRGCTEQEINALADYERMYAIPPADADTLPHAWRGDLERVESEALRLYFERNDVRRSLRLWHLKRITILRHLVDRGRGQPWGLDAPKVARSEL